jgi:hypothetical protein
MLSSCSLGAKLRWPAPSAASVKEAEPLLAGRATLPAGRLEHLLVLLLAHALAALLYQRSHTWCCRPPTVFRAMT